MCHIHYTPTKGHVLTWKGKFICFCVRLNFKSAPLPQRIAWKEGAISAKSVNYCEKHSNNYTQTHSAAHTHTYLHSRTCEQYLRLPLSCKHFVAYYLAQLTACELEIDFELNFNANSFAHTHTHSHVFTKFVFEWQANKCIRYIVSA